MKRPVSVVGGNVIVTNAQYEWYGRKEGITVDPATNRTQIPVRSIDKSSTTELIRLTHTHISIYIYKLNLPCKAVRMYSYYERILDAVQTLISSSLSLHFKNKIVNLSDN
jgi:hypothetical protein